ncbi:MAG: hypothetical protein FJ271_25325 [Planctomycetes bacterium]|nr:hypothetical protein [Planctomycetota bacterium]
MKSARKTAGTILGFAACLIALGTDANARAELPCPVLHSIFPSGGQAGTSVDVAMTGIDLEGLQDIRSTVPGLTAKKTAANRFTLTIPKDTPPGVYDLSAVGLHGISSPRAFFVSNRAEQLEREPNDTFERAQEAALDMVLNGQIQKAGDVDCYRFTAKAGQRVVLECFAKRIDSQLRAVLEVYDADGKRLAANRGYADVDPLVDFLAPADGTYFAKVFDLSFLGSVSCFYRLDIDTRPRVEFSVPCVVTRGRSTRVKLYGRNLLQPEVGAKPKRPRNLDCVEVEVTPPETGRHDRVPLPLQPPQLSVDGFAYYYPGGHAPVMIGLTDVPVTAAAADNHVPDRAQEIPVPCEVSGQLSDGDERHWYGVQVRRGEVLWLEAFGERIGSPVDLAVAVLDPSGGRELKKLADCLENIGGYRFPTMHADPSGRWVAPADGRYLIVVRNLIGGQKHDSRRLYRLSVRREERDFDLAVISRRLDRPAGLNVRRGGREMLEVLAIRRRGLTGPIRVTAGELPPGIEAPDIWIGPGQDRAPLVLTANQDCPSFIGAVNIVGHADIGGKEIARPARGGTMIWPGRPRPSGRLTQEVTLATAPQMPLLLTASTSEAVVDQESVIDIAIDVEQRFQGPTEPVHLTATGLPRVVENAIATIPAGKSKGWLSLYLPESLPPGPYTFAVLGETEMPLPAATGGASAGSAKVGVKLVSNPITIHVRPARIALEIDPRAPRKIGRGKIIQLNFTAERKHGFIGKIHTELAAPGGVTGIRARGVTLVGQSSSGSLQVIATDNASLGRLTSLRLVAVGTVEDRPVYRASRFVDLEITE